MSEQHAPRPVPAPPAAGPAESVAAQLSEATAVLDTLGDRPLAEHVSVYEDLHRQVQAALSRIESA